MFSPVKEKGSSSVKEKGSSPVKDTSRPPRATVAAGRPRSPQQNPREKPYMQPRNPKNAAQKSQSSNFMAKRPPASPSGEAVRYQHGGDLSCDRRPSACESAPCRKMQAEKQLAIERRRVEVEAELSSSRRRLSLMEWL